MTRRNNWKKQRRTRYEELETRLALSAASIAPPELVQFAEEAPPLMHFQQPAAPPLQHFGGLAPVLEIGETLSSPQIGLPADFEFELVAAEKGGDVDTQYAGVHDATGVSYVRDHFGFRGAGQTVAVIDSGVAWDHVDLGGGLGAGHRVVGGWDFAENDADPFDDGPSGFHGTHVAGIVGGSNETYSGVAPEADIVALRVFDDNGSGYFHWVEQALQWVHEHREEFENPITAVNLSLGANWNADSVPGWAMLEDEFAQLEEDGVFIAVAAGNSFQQYASPGLAYPAVSPYVTPVASLDANGNLSYFSQRNDRVLAAPGRNIVSTVPDARGNNDGAANDYGSASGTSMASPYVAGASVLVREAMQFAGMEGITQDTIYDHLRDTAQTFFDPATSADYHRIDLQAAIDALMPEDEFGAGDAAHQLGGFEQIVSIDGVINRLDDVDSFTFTADVSGEMRWDVSGATHSFVAHWSVDGAEYDADGDSLAFDVVGGQTYTVSLNSSGGVGRYSFDAEFIATDPNFGTVDVAFRNGMSFNEDLSELSFTASRTGLMTVEAFFAAADGNVNLRVKDAHGAVVGFGGMGGDNERVDADVIAGHQYTIEVIGANQHVDMRLTNLVHSGNGTVTVFGTDGDDEISVASGGTHHIRVNDVDYYFAASEVRSVRVFAGGGDDHVQMTGSYSRDYAEMRDGYSRMSSDSYEYQAWDAESVEFSSVGRDDLLRIRGTAGENQLVSDINATTLTARGLSLSGIGFERVYVDATAGEGNTATLHDTHGADKFVGHSDHAILQGVDYYKHISGFGDITVLGSTGRDVAELYDTKGDEVFVGRHDVSTMTGDGFEHTVHGFDEVRAHASEGFDKATLYDSSGNERYDGRQSQSSMRGATFVTIARGFDHVSGVAENGGHDLADVYDSSGDDTAHMRHDETVIRSDSYYNAAHGFDQVALRSVEGGDDAVHFIDSEGDDRFYGHSTHALLRGDGYYNQANGFDSYYAHAVNGGNDTAQLYDSKGNDVLSAYSTHAVFRGETFYHNVRSFDRVFAYAQLGGDDRAKFFDSTGSDHFVSTPTQSEMSGDGFYNMARGFDKVSAYAVHGGNDSAELRDSNGDDRFIGTARWSRMTGDGFKNLAYGFERVVATASGGADRAVLRGTRGHDSLIVSAHQTVLNAADTELAARGFDRVASFAGRGRDHVTFQDVGSDQRISARRGVARLRGADFVSVAYSIESREIVSVGDLSAASSQSNVHAGELDLQQATISEAKEGRRMWGDRSGRSDRADRLQRTSTLDRVDAPERFDAVLAPTTNAEREPSEEAQWQAVLDDTLALIDDAHSLYADSEMNAVDDLFSTFGAA